MSHNATSLASWIKAIKLTLDQAGVDSLRLFTEAGLDISTLDDPNARYPLENTARLWKLGVAATDNHNLGLDVGRNINQTTFHALGYSLLASATLKECFERMVRYFRIVTDAGELEFKRSGQNYKFVINPIPGEVQPADESVDALMMVICRLCRQLYGRDFAAIKVSFQRQAPPDSTVFEKVFKAPLEFAAQEISMLMSAELLEESLAAANPELARHNEEILARYLAKFDRNNLANRVHAALVEQLPLGEPSQEKVAEHLHTSLRNLQRKLGAEGTSYKEILNETRRDLAHAYMSDNGYTLSEITYLLGFSDTSSFTRAFKRWTGLSPTEYRKTV